MCPESKTKLSGIELCFVNFAPEKMLIQNLPPHYFLARYPIPYTTIINFLALFSCLHKYRPGHRSPAGILLEVQSKRQGRKCRPVLRGCCNVP